MAMVKINPTKILTRRPQTSPAAEGLGCPGDDPSCQSCNLYITSCSPGIVAGLRRKSEAANVGPVAGLAQCQSPGRDGEHADSEQGADSAGRCELYYRERDRDSPASPGRRYHGDDDAPGNAGASRLQRPRRLWPASASASAGRPDSVRPGLRLGAIGPCHRQSR